MNKLVLVVIPVLVVIIVYTSFTNSKVMNSIVNEGTEIVKKENSLEELDIGKYKTVYIYKVLPFKSKVYNIDGIGIFTTMSLNLGIMQQLTFEITPYKKDLAQLTIDFTILFRKRELRVELYELMVNKEDTFYKNFEKKIDEINDNYSALEDISVSETWLSDYLSDSFIKKRGEPKDEEKLLKLFTEVIEAYMEYAKEVPTLSEADQKKKYDAIKEFSDLLVEKGGIAINNFKRSLGDEKTKEFLGMVLYGYLHIK